MRRVNSAVPERSAVRRLIPQGRNGERFRRAPRRISYIAAVFALSGGAERLIVAAFAVRPPMSQLGQTEKNPM